MNNHIKKAKSAEPYAEFQSDDLQDETELLKIKIEKDKLKEKVIKQNSELAMMRRVMDNKAIQNNEVHKKIDKQKDKIAAMKNEIKNMRNLKDEMRMKIKDQEASLIKCNDKIESLFSELQDIKTRTSRSGWAMKVLIVLFVITFFVLLVKVLTQDRDLEIRLSELETNLNIQKRNLNMLETEIKDQERTLGIQVKSLYMLERKLGVLETIFHNCKHEKSWYSDILSNVAGFVKQFFGSRFLGIE